MRFIIGGANSGKCRLVENKYGITEILDADFDTVMTAAAVKNFHFFVRKMLDENCNITNMLDKICDINPNITIISTEIGYGIVPMDKSDREWRESVGRACCYIAEKAETVIRVVCDVGNVIK